MRIGSLFSGIGGLELGLEWAGVGHTAWQVELDPYCRDALAHTWPDALRFADVRDVGAHNLPHVEVLCGGFPCQDVTVSGRRAGIAPGTRSGLWIEYCRIIRELRPRFAVVENVGGLRTHERGLNLVLGDLASIGYDATWSVLTAAEVGSPQERRRQFIIAWREWEPIYDLEEFGRCECCEAWYCPRCDQHAYDCGCWTQGQLDADDSGLWESVDEPWGTVAYYRGPRGAAGVSGSEPRQEGDAGVLHHSRGALGWDDAIVVEGADGTQRAIPRSAAEQGAQSPLWPVAYGVPNRASQLRVIGNAVVPQCAEVVGRRLLEIGAER